MYIYISEYILFWSIARKLQRFPMKQIYTIFSKSFDSLNHDLLVRKLDLLGIPVDHLKWILSYLNCSLLSTSLPLSRYLWCPTRDPFGSATFYFVFKRPSLKL